MKLKHKKGYEFTFDHRDSNSILIDPIVIHQINAFKRHEPEDNDPKPFSVHQSYVLWICLSGKGILMVDGIPYIFTASNAIITFPGQQHRRLTLEGEKIRWLLVRFSADCPKWFNIFRSRIMNMSKNSCKYLEEFNDRFLTALHENNPETGQEAAYYLSLLLNSLRTAEELMTPAISTSETNEYVQLAIQLIMSPEFLGKSYRVIAREIGISPAYLREIFKKYIGLTPSDIINSHKHKHMQYLLLNSILNITQIAEKCGYDNVYSFSRYFKKQTGISPSQFRRKHQHNNHL